MSIVSSELIIYKSVNVNDASSNGGRLSSVQVVDAQKNNVWPNVPQSERTSGSTKYRKLFYKVANDDDLSLITPKVFADLYTPGEDRINIFPGTQTDTQADISSPRLYGNGKLNADVSATATSFDVLVEDATDAIFQNGDPIRISDSTDALTGDGNEEWFNLDATTGVSWNGNVATLTLESGSSLVNSYLASNTRVSSVIETATIETSSSNWTETTTSGTYDETTYPLVLDNIGTTYELWTITFTSATDFDCIGDTIGSVGSGSISSDFSPNNADFTKPYFTLSSSGWGGTWASGETITFTTSPAAYPFWEVRVIDPGTASLSSNTFKVSINGESE